MEYWSWILTAVGLTGFVLAGKKVWWCWYINIACQALWMTYAIVTEQWGFIVAALAYTFVFTKNAIEWTRDHRQKQEIDAMQLGVMSPNEIRRARGFPPAGSVMWQQPEPPCDPLPGDIWHNPDTGVTKAWSDALNDWEPIVPLKIDASQIRAGTISAKKITSHRLRWDRKKE